MPLSLILKYKPLYYFTHFVNVVGAFVAILVPDLNGWLFEYWTLNFIYEHTFAFTILAVALGVMQKTKSKDFKSAFVVYTIYFIFSLLINTYVVTIDPSTNYFFMMSDFLVLKFYFFKPIRAITYTIELFGVSWKFYPLYQLMIYVFFSLFMLIQFWIYKYFYKVAADWGSLFERSKSEKSAYREFFKELEGPST